jgi:prepilin-type N-terminal cleavage/methylation domain-containing protein
MKLQAHSTASRAAGFSLIEVMIVVTILGVVIGSLSLMGIASDRAYRTGATSAQLESQAVTTTERIVADLCIAADDSLSPDPVAGAGASAIEYVQALGLEDGEVQWSGLRRLAFEYEAGEVDDGLDNNGNGLADEGRVVLRDEIGGPAERRRTLTHWVREHLAGEIANGLDDNGNGLIDEPGFVVERLGETLVIRLTLERADAEGRLLTRTTKTSARLRN